MSLSEMLALVRKHLVFIVVLTLGVFVAACVRAALLPSEYTATTTMYVLTRDVSTDLQELGQSEGQEQSNDSSPVTSAELNYSSMIGSEVSALMNSDRARQQVAERLGLSSLSGFSIANVDAQSSRIITIAVTGPDPQQVADVANAEVEVASDIAATIMNVEAINVIDPAVPPTSPSGPNRKRYALLGLAAGLAASILLILAADELDTRIHSSEDVEEIVDIPVIGHFPSASDDDSGVSNAAKTLLANIRFMGVDDPLRTIAVTSPAPDEGKTFVAARLAKAIATSGKTVLLIEGDMRRRSMASTLGVSSEYGVYSVMTGEKGLRDAIVSTAIPNLYFLDCEASIPTPSDLLSSQSYSRLIAYAKAMFDYVVFDTPPIGAFVDSAVLGSKVDAMLVVVRENYTRKPDIKVAIDQLSKAGCNLAGIVMNFCDPSSGGYYSYYYYGYYYGRDGKRNKKQGLFHRNVNRDMRGAKVGGLRGWMDGRAASRAEQSHPTSMYVPQVSDHYGSRSSTPVIAPGPAVAATPIEPIAPVATTSGSSAAPAASMAVTAPQPSTPAAPAAAPTHASDAHASASVTNPAGITTNFASLSEQIAQTHSQRSGSSRTGKHSAPAKAQPIQRTDGDAEEF